MVSGMPRRRGGTGPAVYRITGARQSLEDDVRGRQRRYVISMLVRTVAVLLTVLLWNVSRPLSVVTLVLGLVLPYIAVVIANAGRENAPSLPSTFITSASRPSLPPGRGGEGPDDHKRS
jgi:hypothetical protein